MLRLDVLYFVSGEGKAAWCALCTVSKVPKIWVFLYMYVVLSIDDCIIYLFALFRGSYDGVQCCLVILLWHTCSTEESINIKLLYFYRVCTSMFPSSI